MKKLYLIFLSLFVFWGCGGDGGSGDSPQAPVVSGGALSITWNMSQSASVEENSNGATLLDATLNNSTAQLSFSLSGTDSSKFSISNGYLVFTDVPDYENPLDSNADNSYALTINASGAGISSTHSFSVIVNNVNEAPSLVTDSTAYFQVNENLTEIKQITASDPENDTLVFSLQNSSGSEDEGLLQIDSSTGIVSFKSAPNYESPTDINSDNTVIFTVSVSDGSFSVSQKYYAAVNNVAESPTDISFTTDTVPENLPGVSFGTISLVDEDPVGISNIIISGLDAFQFEIGSGHSLKFKPTVSGNFESKPSYSVTIEVTDTENNTLSKDLTLTITDANDPPTSVSILGGSAAENSAGASFGTLSTTDPDASDSFTYSVTGGTDASSFEIGANNNLKFKSAVAANFESKNSYSVIVTSTDAGSNTYSETLVVTITNVNEAPSFENYTSTTAEVPENITGGFTTVLAFDPESNSLTYSLGSGNDTSKFSITAAGVLSFNRAPDFEIPSDSDENNTYVVNLTVSDGSLSTSFALTVTVYDLNEPVALNVPENVQTVETQE